MVKGAEKDRNSELGAKESCGEETNVCLGA